MLYKTTVLNTKALAEHERLLKTYGTAIHAILQMDLASTFTKLTQHSTLIQNEVRILSDTAKFAQVGKINPEQIPWETLQGISDFVYSVETERGLVSPIDKPSDIFSMPMSYLYDLEKGQFEFIVHIPLTRKEQVLSMHEFLPFPMTLTNDRTRVAIPRTGERNILAFNKANEYQILSALELQGCFKLKKVHYCKNRQILRTNWQQSCLSALYIKDHHAASQYCDFQIQPAHEQVFKVKDSEYLVYTSRDITTDRECKGRTNDKLNVRGGSTIYVPQGCNVRLEDHVIYGEAATTVGFETPKMLSWSWDAQRLLNNASTAQLQAAIQNMESEAGTYIFETEDILQQMALDDVTRSVKTNSNPFAFVHWVASLISAAATFVMAFFLIQLARFWIRRRRSGPKDEQPPPYQDRIGMAQLPYRHPSDMIQAPPPMVPNQCVVTTQVPSITYR